MCNAPRAQLVWNSWSYNPKPKQQSQTKIYAEIHASPIGPSEGLNAMWVWQCPDVCSLARSQILCFPSDL